MKKIFVTVILTLICLVATVTSFAVNDITAYTHWVTTNAQQFEYHEHTKKENKHHKEEKHDKDAYQMYQHNESTKSTPTADTSETQRKS